MTSPHAPGSTIDPPSGRVTHTRDPAQERSAPHVSATEERAHEAFSRGDTRAVLTALMHGYGDEISRHCFYIVNDRHAAEDLRQAVFVQAAEDLARFQGRSSWRTWLRSIARHRAIDAVRRRRRWRKRLLFTDAVPEIAGSSGELEKLDYPKFEQALYTCLDKLAPRTREMVLLRYMENLSYAEISALTGARLDAVRKRVHRTMPQLRACLEQRGVEP